MKEPKEKKERKKPKFRSKRNKILLCILDELHTLNALNRQFIGECNKKRPKLNITKFEITQVKDKDDFFSFEIKGKNGLRVECQMNFWNCMMVLNSLREWKSEEQK